MDMPSSIELSALEVLVAVADHGSLSAAARYLRQAQPNVSRSLARLERRLGLPLLQRSTSGSKLTTEGVLVVEWARDLLRDAENLVHNCQVLSGESGAKMAVSASQTVAEHLLPGWLAAFRERDPSVLVKVKIRNTAGVLEDLHSGECDVGFVEGPVPAGGVHLSTVAEDRLVLVTAPSHPWAKRKQGIATDQLHHKRLITREAGSGTRRVLDDALGVPVVPLLELESNAAVKVAVLSGAGPAVLSSLAVADALANGTLIELVLDDFDLRRRLRAAWTGPRQLGGIAADFLQIAKKSAQEPQ